MSSVESTQQPSWHTRSKNPPQPSSTDIGTSLPNGETCASTSTGPEENSESWKDWMSNQMAPQSLPLSIEPVVPQPLATNHATGPVQAQPNPSASAKWRTKSSSPGSSQRAPPSDAVDEVDKLVSEPSSRPKRSQGEEVGPSVSSPSKGDREQGQTTNLQPIPLPSLAKPLSPGKSPHTKISTPTKHYPLSTFTPSLSSRKAAQSPSKRGSSSKSPLRPSTKFTPSSRRPPRIYSDSQDSFVEREHNPLQRLNNIMQAHHRERANEGGALTRAEVEADNLLNLAGDPDPPLVSWERVQAYQSPSLPPPAAAPAAVVLPNEGPSNSPQVNVSPSAQPTITLSPQRIGGGTFTRFGDIPSSSGGAEMSQIFSDSSVHEFGTQGSPQTFHMAATQVVVYPQHGSPQAFLPMSQGLVQQSHDSIPSEVSPALSRPLPVGVGRTHSATSNTTTPSVPEHRRLGRVNPRVEEHVVHPIIGPNRPVSMPYQALPHRHVGLPLSDPGHGRPDIEPTQIDELFDQPSQRPVAAAALQDTFIDAPSSPPIDTPVDQTTPRQDIASLPPSSPNKLAASPLAPPEVELQPTYIDPRSLPLPPPRVSPKQYVGRRKGRKTISEDDEDEPGSPSPGNEDQTVANQHVSEAPLNALSPVPWSGQPMIHEDVDDLAPRRRGKRRMSQSSDFTSGGGGEDSSPAPEDPEDYTYRPLPKTNGTATKQTRSKATNTRARASSVSTNDKQPVRKKVKLNEPVATPSGRSELRAKRERRVTPSSPLTELPSTPRRLRVWAWWAQEKAYFAGTVTDRKGTKFHISFDDGTSRGVTIDRLRRLELQKGDQIRADSSVGKGLLEVAEDWQDESKGNSRGVQFKEDGQDIGLVALVEMCVPDKVIKDRFDDRRVLPSDLGVTDDFKPAPRAKSPVKVVNVFSGKVFLITAATNNITLKDQETIASKIRKHGGKVVDDWQKLFDLPLVHGFGSTIKVKEAPFVITMGGEGLKAKALAALASGIPCLASAFIDAAIDRDADWRAYLISPGISKLTGNYISQLVDPSWGRAHWKPNLARPRQPFAGLDFVYLEPCGKTLLMNEVRPLMPFCVHAMGAKSLQPLKSTSEIVNIAAYDIVLIESRCKDHVIPQVWKDSGKLCDFGWLKQCIIAGARLPNEADIE